MTKISNDQLRQMQIRRERGDSYKQIAEAMGFKYTTVFNRLRRSGSGFAAHSTPRTTARDRTTRFVFFNGGCSGLSGLVPVTLPRLRCLETAVTA